jgi:hypothetical protein
VSKKGDDVDSKAAAREPLLPPPESLADNSEFTSDTSLTDLFQAILGVEARRTHDKSELGKVVDAQIRALRQELDLPEPVERPVPVPSDPLGERALFGTAFQEADEAGHSNGARRPSWRDLVTGLADRAKNSVGLKILVSIATAIA